MSKDLLLNPRTYDPAHFDPETRRLLRATVDWFETRGKKALIGSYVDRVWYADFLDFAAKEGLFATFLTPAADAAGVKRWDTARNAALNEILGFYGLQYWYTWQVTILGLGPIWMSANAEARARAAALLAEGHLMAFGLSEKSTAPTSTRPTWCSAPDGTGGFRANGDKYYIGNGNGAGLVSVFGRRDIAGTDDYVFFAADSRHPQLPPGEERREHADVRHRVRSERLPGGEEDILHTGQAAWDAALNTVNVGKFNLAGARSASATHAFYEAITHAHNRRLYGRRVTDFPHVRREFTDAYARLVAMKLFASAPPTTSAPPTPTTAATCSSTR